MKLTFLESMHRNVWRTFVGKQFHMFCILAQGIDLLEGIVSVHPALKQFYQFTHHYLPLALSQMIEHAAKNRLLLRNSSYIGVIPIHSYSAYSFTVNTATLFASRARIEITSAKVFV